MYYLGCFFIIPRAMNGEYEILSALTFPKCAANNDQQEIPIEHMVSGR